MLVAIAYVIQPYQGDLEAVTWLWPAFDRVEGLLHGQFSSISITSERISMGWWNISMVSGVLSMGSSIISMTSSFFSIIVVEEYK